MQFNQDHVCFRYDIPPDMALKAIRAHEGLLLVDLDETLYLGNSTEDFIDCARPGMVALLLLRFLDVLKPWRWTGGNNTRDNWRACATLAFFPWSAWRWRARVLNLAACQVNQELKCALAARRQAPSIILTSGFKPIVTPLLTAMGFSDVPLIASRLFPFGDRRRGKLALAVNRLGMDTVAQSMVITDSVGDLDLLRNCAYPMRTLWPQARYRKALSGVYLPGEYISKIKHPGERYILRAIIQQDFAFWYLSSMGLAANLALHACGLLLLLLSFWAIYERGYVDNDLAAFRHETDPRLTAAFETTSVATPPLQPWIWALLAGAAGAAISASARSDVPLHLALWTVVLVATYACFICYNRVDKKTRIWLYPLLQLARSAAPIVVVSIEPAGAAALAAHMLSRWVPYQVYRSGAADWPDMQPELIRLLSFMLLLALMGCSLGLSVFFTWATLALLLWNLVRARHDVCKVVLAARRLDRHTRPAGSGSQGLTAVTPHPAPTEMPRG